MFARLRKCGLDSVDLVVVAASVFFGAIGLTLAGVLWYVVAVLP